NDRVEDRRVDGRRGTHEPGAVADEQPALRTARSGHELLLTAQASRRSPPLTLLVRLAKVEHNQQQLSIVVTPTITLNVRNEHPEESWCWRSSGVSRCWSGSRPTRRSR